MILRYSDRPMESPITELPNYNTGDWFAQLKEDGWFTFIVKDPSQKICAPEWAKGKNKDLFFLSRRGKTRGGPTQMPVNDVIVDAVDGLNLPNSSMLSAEWMARRTIGECPETLFVHDLLWLQDKWMGKVAALSRWEYVQEIVRKSTSEFLTVPVSTIDTDISGFFEKHKNTVPHAEGIVAKHKKGTLKGDVNDGTDNPLIIKIKWRSGDTGRESVQ